MSDIKPWKTLQTDIIFENPRFKVRKDICQLPEGTIVQDYIVREEEDIAIIFCLTKNNDIVLVRQFRQAAQAVTLEAPGGTRERHDINIAETARRELLEETGYTADRMEEIATWHLSPSSSTAMVHLFFAVEAEKIAATKFVIGETTEVVLKPVNELRALLEEGGIIGVAQVAALYRGLAQLGKETA